MKLSTNTDLLVDFFDQVLETDQERLVVAMIIRELNAESIVESLLASQGQSDSSNVKEHQND